MHNSPFNNTQSQSELIKAGVHFDFNKVDTICNRKLGLSFYCALLALIVLLCFPHIIGISKADSSRSLYLTYNQISNIFKSSALSFMDVYAYEVENDIILASNTEAVEPIMGDKSRPPRPSVEQSHNSIDREQSVSKSLSQKDKQALDNTSLHSTMPRVNDKSRGVSSINITYISLLIVLGLYLVYYVARLMFFLRLRAKLRKDIAPIVVEAYAVVRLDLKRKLSDYILEFLFGPTRLNLVKYAVIYKEVGSNSPRYFLSAAVSCSRLCFIPEQIGRVFLDRKNSKLYTLDDLSAYQTASERRRPISQVLMPHAFSVSAHKNREHKNADDQSL